MAIDSRRVKLNIKVEGKTVPEDKMKSAGETANDLLEMVCPHLALVLSQVPGTSWTVDLSAQVIDQVPGAEESEVYGVAGIRKVVETPPAREVFKFEAVEDPDEALEDHSDVEDFVADIVSRTYKLDDGGVHYTYKDGRTHGFNDRRTFFSWLAGRVTRRFGDRNAFFNWLAGSATRRFGVVDSIEVTDAVFRQNEDLLPEANLIEAQRRDRERARVCACEYIKDNLYRISDGDGKGKIPALANEARDIYTRSLWHCTPIEPEPDFDDIILTELGNKPEEKAYEAVVAWIDEQLGKLKYIVETGKAPFSIGSYVFHGYEGLRWWLKDRAIAVWAEHAEADPDRIHKLVHDLIAESDHAGLAEVH